MWRLLPLVAVAACSSSTGSDPTAVQHLGLNDVSVLVPLPADVQAPALLRASDAGGRGALLPRDVFDKVPTFPITTGDTLDYDLLRVVGVRFDGCFPGKTGCEAQIRLVLQPVESYARDAALHLFYSLTTDELAGVVAELRHLRTLAPEIHDAPLDVHAALVAQGPNGAYGAALRALVLAHAGEQNLSRITFFLRAPPKQETWFLGGFARASGVLDALDIVGVGKGNQRVIRADVEQGFHYDFLPEGRVPEDHHLLLDSAGATTAPLDDVKAAYASLLRIENPTKHGPDDLPCAGCHVSTFVTSSIAAARGLSAMQFPADAFSSTHDLSQRGPAATTASSLRAFGWFETMPMISQRVVNESAAVVDDLEQRFPAVSP